MWSCGRYTGACRLGQISQLPIFYRVNCFVTDGRSIVFQTFMASVFGHYGYSFLTRMQAGGSIILYKG